MKNVLRFTICAISAGLVSQSALSADTPETLADAISGGQAKLALRYRFEYVDDFVNREALASTLKTRLSYQTLPFNGVSAKLEMDNNSVVGEDNYSDSAADPDEEAVVLDATTPKSTKLT